MTERQVEAALELIRAAKYAEQTRADRRYAYAVAEAHRQIGQGVPWQAAAVEEREAADAAYGDVRSLECAETSLLAWLRRAADRRAGRAA